MAEDPADTPIEFCQFGKRDLDKTSWAAPLVNNRLGDAFNLELRHEQLFFIRGEEVSDNVGFSEKGTRFNEADFGKPIRNLDDMRRNGYWLVGRRYDPLVMREALKRQKDGNYYSFFSNQCQDWADRLRRNAVRVEKEWGVRPGEFLHGKAPEARPGCVTTRRVSPTEPASITMAIVALVLGICSILSPYFAGGSFALILGLFFTASGISHGIYAFKGHDWHAGAPVLFFGFLNLVGGLFMILNTQIAVMGVSLLIGIMLGFQGATNVFLAAFSRPLEHWLGTLFGGLALLVCSAMILFRWPESGERLLGAAVGISLISGGLSTIYLSRQIRSDHV
jgi:uncharacterized membrane protein HdeD (DUF308 family)